MAKVWWLVKRHRAKVREFYTRSAAKSRKKGLTG